MEQHFLTGVTFCFGYDKQFFTQPSLRLTARRRLLDPEVDIVIPVHNAWHLSKSCIQSVLDTRDETIHRIIVIDDGSDDEAKRGMIRLGELSENFILSRSEFATGFTKAANRGLRLSNAPVVIVLNSDTIVEGSWISKLSRTLLKTPGVGIVGPLSNAASFQSIPRNGPSPRERAVGQTPINDLPEGMDICKLNKLLEEQKAEPPFRVPLIHGFCFTVRREVINDIGYFDEEAFPYGYGEEDDYCIRAVNAGWSLAISTDTYVWHKKSGSYTTERRRELVKLGGAKLIERYGEQRIKNIIQSLSASGAALEAMFENILRP